jgi:biopolymer transport protein ExbB/TolQ
MNAVEDLLKAGGPILIPIMALSVILYERCSTLLIFLLRSRRSLRNATIRGPEDVLSLRKLQDELLEAFWRQRSTISAMIKAAPLLGLLGTVIGMIHTFDNLALEAGKKSVEGLTGGISVALVSTEAGLGVAIPAILVLYFAQRQVQKAVHALVTAEAGAMRPA